jgi:TnpA family transposase
VQLGRLLRTAFLADYFVKDAFRNELRRVLNRGEAVKEGLHNPGASDLM